MNDLKTCEGNIVKRTMGFNKRSHHNVLYNALGITSIDNVIHRNIQSLFFRIFQVNTPLLHLQSVLLSKYLCKRKCIKGTLIDRLVKAGHDPLHLAFYKPAQYMKEQTEDGVVDSLKYLIFHENYIKPWSDEHFIATLLTKAF